MFKKSNKRFMLFLLLLAMFCILLPGTALATSTWDGTIPDANPSYTFSGGGGSSSNPYLISTAADFAQLASNVKNGTAYSGIHFKLTEDINLNGKEWEPIGGRCGVDTNYVPNGNSFQGIFDGDNHTVSGLSITTTVPGGTAAYGLFGYVNGGIIANLTVSGAITLSGFLEDIGGVVGYTNNSLYNCHNQVDITAVDSTNVGGVAGAVEPPANPSNVVYVQYCSNAGDIDASRRIGGIAGAAYCDDFNDLVVDQCFNTGYIWTRGTSYRSYTGGITGYCEGFLTNCYNRGGLYADGPRYQSGIVGLLASYTTDPALRMESCYSTAAFDGSPSPDYQMRLFASADHSTTMKIENCFWLVPALDNSEVSQQIGDTWGDCNNIAKVDEEQLSGTKALNEISIVDDGNLGALYAIPSSSSVNDGYPILIWQAQSDFKVGDLTAGTPTTSFTYTDDATHAIFLDGVNGNDSYDGTSAEYTSGTTGPVKTFAKARSLLTDTRHILYIVDRVTVSSPESWSLPADISDAVVMRSCTYHGYLVEVASGGDLELSDIIINGNRYDTTNNPDGIFKTTSDSLILVDGGSLTVNSGTVLQYNFGKNGGAIRLESGSVNMAGGTISGNTSATGGSGVSMYGDTFTLTPATGVTFDLADTIYLTDGNCLSIGATLANITGNLTVRAQTPVEGLVIAEVTGSYEAFDRNDALQFAYETGEWFFELDGTETKILLQYL